MRNTKMCAAVMSILTVVGMAATGCSAGANEPKAAPASERGPITVATGNGDFKRWAKPVAEWNSSHPNEKVTLVDLGNSADQQRQKFIQNAETKSPAYTVLGIDTVWTAEFAAHKWIVPMDKELIPSDVAPAALEAATYRDSLYAAPMTVEGGMLYYRTDLLKTAGIAKPPTTWDEMEADCKLIQATPEGHDASCYAGTFEKYEGLTVNFAGAINSAGGVIVDKDGNANVDTPEALQGLSTLVDAFKAGVIPKEAISWKEDDGRQAFQDGKLIFHRQWSYQYSLANAKDGTSKVAGKFNVTTLPGIGGHPGASTLGGGQLALSAFANNTQTAKDFIKFLSGPDTQRAFLEEYSQPPAILSIYDDPALAGKYPYLPVLRKSLEGAASRPTVVNYGDATAAIQEAAYGALTQKMTPKEALTDLQSKLEAVIKK